MIWFHARYTTLATLHTVHTVPRSDAGPLLTQLTLTPDCRPLQTQVTRGVVSVHGRSVSSAPPQLKDSAANSCARSSKHDGEATRQADGKAILSASDAARLCAGRQASQLQQRSSGQEAKGQEAERKGTTAGTERRQRRET